MHKNLSEIELSAVYCVVQSHNYIQNKRISNKEATFFTF